MAVTVQKLNHLGNPDGEATYENGKFISVDDGGVLHVKALNGKPGGVVVAVYQKGFWKSADVVDGEG